jgi:hypothetical protein
MGPGPSLASRNAAEARGPRCQHPLRPPRCRDPVAAAHCERREEGRMRGEEDIAG